MRKTLFILLLSALFAAPSLAQWCAEDIAGDIGYLKQKWTKGAVDRSTGLDARGMGKALQKIVAERGDEPWQITKAKIFAYACDHVAIGVSTNDYFPAVFPWTMHRNHPIRSILKKRADDVDQSRSPGLKNEISSGTADGSWVVWKDYSHCAPDWDYIIKLGFPGMRQQLLDNWKDTDYYRSRLIVADAVLRFVSRLAKKASKKAIETGDERLKAQASSLDRLCRGKPQSAYDVLMFIYLEWVMGENFDFFQVRTLSNLDRILMPFYKSDIASGKTNEDVFRDQLAHFWWQWGAIDNYYGQPVYFGGTKADGTTQYNEISAILLDVHDKLNLPTPKVHIKTGPSTPDWVWRKTLDLARRQRSVTFCGEEPLAKAIMGLGYSAEQARTCAIWGCYEWGILDSCNDTIPSYISAVKPIEKLLNKARTGKYKAKDFETFLSSYFKKLSKTVEKARSLAFETERWVHEVNPSMLFSLSIAHSVKTGLDAFHNGTAHGNNSHLLLVAPGTAVDALMAVKEIVYERKILSLKQLGEVMAKNWSGYENLRLEMINSRRKWGNNDNEANMLGRMIISCFGEKANNIPNSRGGRFVAGAHSSRRFIDFGKRTGATPDGRFAKDELSKNLSPMPGADREGVTALINTVSSINPADVPMDMPLDVMLHPSSVAGEKGLDVMRTLVEEYHSRGLTLIQFNVLDAQTLRAAQKEPEKYENLQVRVCGWNVRWNDLPVEQQDCYIRRAESIK